MNRRHFAAGVLGHDDMTPAYGYDPLIAEMDPCYGRDIDTPDDIRQAIGDKAKEPCGRRAGPRKMRGPLSRAVFLMGWTRTPTGGLTRKISTFSTFFGRSPPIPTDSDRFWPIGAGRCPVVAGAGLLIETSRRRDVLPWWFRGIIAGCRLGKTLSTSGWWAAVPAVTAEAARCLIIGWWFHPAR